MSSQTASTSPFAVHLETWLHHIRVLSQDIGPRGSTTPGERQGHEYCQKVLAELGLSPKWESFRSAQSVFHPFLIVSLMMLGVFVIYPLSGRVSAAIAALLSLTVFVCAVMELLLMDNPLRRLVPKATSQNVFAVISPNKEYRQDLVLVGHVDSQHTPIIFKSPGWLAVYKAFSTGALVSFAAMVLLYILGAITLWSWIWPVSGVSAIFALLILGLCLQAVNTPFTCGANDNATAAGLVLALAAHLHREPLQFTRLWLVCTGSEEALHDGVIDFFRRHRSELHQPKAVVFESLGSSGPSWLVQEGIVLPIRPDPVLVELAERTSRNYPELGAYPSGLSGGVTEMSDAIRAGVPAITLMGLTPENALPNWHQLGDTFDKIDPAALRRNYIFAWHYLQALDHQCEG